MNSIQDFKFSPSTVMTDNAKSFMSDAMNDIERNKNNAFDWGWNFEFKEAYQLLNEKGQWYEMSFENVPCFDNTPWFEKFHTNRVKYFVFENFIPESEEQINNAKHFRNHLLMWEAKTPEVKDVRDHRGRIDRSNAPHNALVYVFNEYLGEYDPENYPVNITF